MTHKAARKMGAYPKFMFSARERPFALWFLGRVSGDCCSAGVFWWDKVESGQVAEVFWGVGGREVVFCRMKDVKFLKALRVDVGVRVVEVEIDVRDSGIFSDDVDLGKFSDSDLTLLRGLCFRLLNLK
jgi:hypothetical protein